MPGLLAGSIQPGELGGRSAGGGNAVDRSEARSKYDHAIAVPRAAASFGRVAEGLRKAASDLDLFQLAAGEEAECHTPW